MNTEYIKEFLTVVQYNSISKAASVLFISPSTISKHILAIENELGVILFKPDTHGSTLTTEGTLFYESIKPVMQSFEGCISAVKSKQALTLKITIHSIHAYQKLYFFITNYKKTFPQTQIEVNNLDNQPLTNALDNCAADIVIGFGNTNTDTKKYTNIEIDKVKLVLATMNHTDSENTDIHCLHDRPILIPALTSIQERETIIDDIFSKEEFPKGQMIETINFNDLITKMSFTNCFAILPSNYVHLFDNSLHIVDNYELPSISLYATFLKDNRKPQILQFINYLKNQKSN